MSGKMEENIMKKLTIVLTLIIVSILAFTGCDNKNDGEESKQTSNEVNNESSNEDKKEESREVNSDTSSDKSSDTIEVVDAFGDTVTLKKNPKNVVCLYNSYLDLWYEAGGEVVGRISTKGEVPEGAEDATIVGTMSKPDMEKIVALQPELVIITGNHTQSEFIDLLKQNNIPYYAVSYTNLQEFLDVYKVFTTLTAHEELYEEKGVKIENEIKEIIAKVPTDKKPSALVLFGTSKSVKAKLPNSQVGSMLEDLGVTNIAYDAQLSDEEMQTFSMERVVQRAPQFVFVQTMGDVEEVKKRISDDVESNPAWGSLDAVKNGKYYYLDKYLFLYKPNMRYAEAYRELAKLLYPEIFGE
jgi:iron complex transport system substrate-binding protein